MNSSSFPINPFVLLRRDPLIEANVISIKKERNCFICGKHDNLIPKQDDEEMITLFKDMLEELRRKTGENSETCSDCLPKVIKVWALHKQILLNQMEMKDIVKSSQEKGVMIEEEKFYPKITIKTEEHLEFTKDIKIENSDFPETKIHENQEEMFSNIHENEEFEDPNFQIIDWNNLEKEAEQLSEIIINPDCENEDSSSNSSMEKVCKYCQKTFQRHQDISIHIRFVHLKEKNFYCDEPGCSQGFGRASDFKRHVEIHKKRSINQGHKCGKCGKCVKEEDCCEEHDKICENKKTMQDSNVCSICLKQFTSKFTLNRHSLSHEAVKLFGCYHCDKRFSRKDLLQKHLSRVKIRVKNARNFYSKS